MKNNPMGIRGLDHFSIPVRELRRAWTATLPARFE